MVCSACVPSFPAARLFRRLVFLLAWGFFLPAGLAYGASLRGTVEGPRGLLAGAEVKLLQQGYEVGVATSDRNGEFLFDNLSAGVYQLQVVFSPYLPVVQEVAVSDPQQVVELTIPLTSLNEKVTVTAERIPMPVASSSSDVKILTGADLRRMPFQTLDEALRLFPEFSLFRRSSSLVAHPTTQGVSLRGIGPSGVSRSLVLVDGVPFNDAFGGWVYWNQAPSLSIQQVEVANGGASPLYGNYGLGGVIQVLHKIPEPGTFEFQGQGGSNNSLDGDFYASHRRGSWGFSTAGSFLDFDGYPIVAESQRGKVDIPAYSRYQAMNFNVERAPAHSPVVGSVAGGFLNEHRGNGTPLTTNKTFSFHFSTGLQWTAGPRDRLEARAFFRRTIFDSNYSSVASDRNSERLTVQQGVPSADGGASLLWYATRGRHSLVGGGDFWLVSGQSNDNVITGQQITRFRLGGARQVTAGLFVEDNLAISSRAAVVLGARQDLWRNYDGFTGNYPASGPPQVFPVGNTTRGIFSPRAGFTYAVNSHLSLYGSVHRSFRAPTLNELYRAFTVGNVVTNANSGLVPEHNFGWELGGRINVRETLRFRLAGFFNRLEQPVSNVTQQILPTQIIRQRRNLGDARIYGIEGGVTWQPTAAVKLEAFYLWDRASVTNFAADPALVGKRLPQVSEHRVSLLSEILLPYAFRVALSGRFVGDQFDDDLNQLVLDRYFRLDADLSRSLGESARLFLALENLTDAKIITNRSPVEFIGAPFQIRGGIYFRFHRRRS